MQFLGKFGKIVCWNPPRELVPPPQENPGSATGMNKSDIRWKPQKSVLISLGTFEGETSLLLLLRFTIR